jgi:hypothetical protein
MSKCYVELLIEGPSDFARGYVRGFVAARGSDAELIFDDEAGFADDGILQRLKEALHLSKELTHCVVDEATAELVREAVNDLDEKDLDIKSDRKIAGASFEYSFAIFNSESGENLLKGFADLPTGVALEGHEQEKTVDPDAKGTEIYAPTHAYELKGHGKAVGPIDKIVWLKKQLDSFDQVEVAPIYVTYGAD